MSLCTVIQHHQPKSVTGGIINLVLMVEIKNLLRSLSMVLLGITINKNIDCLLIKHL